MPRKFRRSYRSSNRDKYSIENTTINPPNAWISVTSEDPTFLPTDQFNISVVQPTDVQGMRKVKHFTLTFSADANEQTMWYALVYVPFGYTPNNLNIPAAGYATSLYEPNQYVMSSGVLDFTGGPCRIRCPLARNLNSGDSIYLVMARRQIQEGPRVYINVQYAITLQ